MAEEERRPSKQILDPAKVQLKYQKKRSAALQVHPTKHPNGPREMQPQASSSAEQQKMQSEAIIPTPSTPQRAPTSEGLTPVTPLTPKRTSARTREFETPTKLPKSSRGTSVGTAPQAATSSPPPAFSIPPSSSTSRSGNTQDGQATQEGRKSGVEVQHANDLEMEEYGRPEGTGNLYGPQNPWRDNPRRNQGHTWEVPGDPEGTAPSGHQKDDGCSCTACTLM